MARVPNAIDCNFRYCVKKGKIVPPENCPVCLKFANEDGSPIKLYADLTGVTEFDPETLRWRCADCKKAERKRRPVKGKDGRRKSKYIKYKDGDSNTKKKPDEPKIDDFI